MSGRAVLAQARLETRLLVRSSESLLITLGIPLYWMAIRWLWGMA